MNLLALDKNGNLVIIENKLDHSGRNVVWQALKYASYCANLTRSEIVKIFQQYLREDNNAEDQICEFLEANDINEVKLNMENSQRVMLVSANFPKEVTNTALWLRGQGISIQCFKTTLYVFGQEFLLRLDQIIPIPEAEEFMIGMNAKKDEEKSTEAVLKEREKLNRSFWEMTLESFEKSDCTLYNNVNPSKDHWLSAGAGVSWCSFALIFILKEIRIELSLENDREKNKFLFDELEKKKEEIENVFGEKLVWDRLEQKKIVKNLLP